jgi:hypothetical protein
MSESLTRRDSVFVHRNILYLKADPAQSAKAARRMERHRPPASP